MNLFQSLGFPIKAITIGAISLIGAGFFVAGVYKNVNNTSVERVIKRETIVEKANSKPGTQQNNSSKNQVVEYAEQVEEVLQEKTELISSSEEEDNFTFPPYTLPPFFSPEIINDEEFPMVKSAMPDKVSIYLPNGPEVKVTFAASEFENKNLVTIARTAPIITQVIPYKSERPVQEFNNE